MGEGRGGRWRRGPGRHEEEERDSETDGDTARQADRRGGVKSSVRDRNLHTKQSDFG